MARTAELRSSICRLTVRVRQQLLTAVVCAAIGFAQIDHRSSLEHYRAGETFLQQGNLQAAANEFREALNGDLEPRWIQSQAHLNLARIFTMTGQYDRAANEYKEAKRWIDITKDPPPPTPPELIDRTDPEYSEEARIAELEGSVVLSASVHTDGSAYDLSVSQPLGLGLSEKALEAVKNWRFKPGAFRGTPISVSTEVSVDFQLPSKQSRWHLIQAEFYPPDGASRPAFQSTHYPPGAGISRASLEEGHLIGAIGRLGTARLSFFVNEQGLPEHFWVDKASDDIWGREAVAVVRDWRFTPGTKEGKPIPVRCTLDLVWGPRILTPRALSWGQAQLRIPVDTFTSPAAGVLRIRVGSEVEESRVITKVPPVYPPQAQARGITGAVRFNALIGVDGRVADLQLISGHPMLVDAAKAAAQQRVYQQTLVNGAAVEVKTEIAIEFTP